MTISGAAGTGKTLLALAGALEQRRQFRQIYLARPIVPLSNRDIGYLPGDIQSKINPYMQPLWDNLGIIKNQFGERDREYKKVDELVEQEKLHIVPLAYIRGRSFANVIFIVDEAQNLTPHEVKTIITRAGERTKIVLTGDIFQIDTPYLDAHSNGLSYLIDRDQGATRSTPTSTWTRGSARSSRTWRACCSRPDETRSARGCVRLRQRTPGAGPRRFARASASGWPGGWSAASPRYQRCRRPGSQLRPNSLRAARRMRRPPRRPSR